MRFYVQILVILAVILSTASPACKFISGQSNTIEICAADGSLQKIAAPDDYQSPVPSEEKHDHEYSDPCAFCFAASHFKPVTPNAITIAIPTDLEIAEQSFVLTSSFVTRSELSGIEARPPPSLS